MATAVKMMMNKSTFRFVFYAFWSARSVVHHRGLCVFIALAIYLSFLLDRASFFQCCCCCCCIPMRNILLFFFPICSTIFFSSFTILSLVIPSGTIWSREIYILYMNTRIHLAMKHEREKSLKSKYPVLIPTDRNNKKTTNYKHTDTHTDIHCASARARTYKNTYAYHIQTSYIQEKERLCWLMTL